MEFSAIASKARCGAGRRRLVFIVDGVDMLIFSTENHRIPGPWLLGTSKLWVYHGNSGGFFLCGLDSCAESDVHMKVLQGWATIKTS